jgi:cobalt-zinc-cadmium efflux system membrane fusion protein
MKPIALIALAAALATVAACGRRAAPVQDAEAAVAPGTVVLQPDSPMLRQIARAPVRAVDLPTDEVIAPGKIEANPARVSKVVLPVTGRIVGVLVKMGDTVTRGQPLLTMQSPDADSAMSSYLSAQASVTQAESVLGKAQADFDRASDLFEHNAVAKKDVLTAESALAQARAAVEQARASREQTQRRLAVLGLIPGNFDQHVVVRSPLAGKVLELSVVAGEYRNDTSTSVLTVADLTTVWVTSHVPESYIRFVQPGEQVEINLVAYPGEVFVGHVARIADTVDPQTRSVKVQAEMNNRDGRLRPEMYGTIHHVESTAKTTVVPIGAVVQNENESVVFVETAPGRFEQRSVTLGKRAGSVVRVASGVKAGEIVAVDGVMLLKGLVKRT